ncbi:MAG: ABC-type transport system, substrate-binding protein [Gemmatimonadetes bacterium]|nr:ABC-type transport system, substrate-binding protein [Gemmatimonadota bacterium]
MRNPRRWSGWAGCALALAAALAVGACSDERQAGGKKPVDTGGTAVLGELVEPSKPMPLVWESDLDADLVDIMYMGLTRPAWRDGHLVFQTSEASPMAMAWHYEYLAPDSTAIRYHMRSGLRWSDGKPITARDVAWTYRTLKDPRVASPRQSDAAQIDSVVAENDSTVTFHFKRRYPDMVFNSSIHVAPEHVYAGGDPGQIRTHPTLVHPEGGRLVVSGPFLVESWQHGQQMTLAPNPNFSVRPRLARIVIRAEKDRTTALTEMKLGHLDFLRPLGFDQLQELHEQAPNVRVARQEKRYYEYLAWNPLTVPAFRDRDVRRALGQAIDVPYLIEGLKMQDYAVPASGPYPPIFKAVYDSAAMRPLRFDPEAAKRTLEAKGWRDTDGDGVRDRDGKPFRFTLLTNSGNQRRADAVIIVQQQLKAVGVDMQIQQMEYATASSRFYKHEYEAALGSWGVALSPDFSAMWSPRQTFNITSYDNPEVNRLMKEAASQPTEALASPLWRQAAQKIVDDQPYTWLYYYDQLFAVSDRLQGMRIDVYGPYQNAWEWWIPADRQGTPGTGKPQ